MFALPSRYEIAPGSGQPQAPSQWRVLRLAIWGLRLAVILGVALPWLTLGYWYSPTWPYLVLVAVLNEGQAWLLRRRERELAAAVQGYDGLFEKIV